MKVIGSLSGYIIIHLKRRFFLFVDTKKRSLFLAELSLVKNKEEEVGQREIRLSGFDPSLQNIYVRWEIKITPIHIILFLLTFVSTTAAGAMIQGLNPFSAEIWKGIYFSLPLLFILSCHEFGHIYAMWKYGVSSSFPYFIPAPNIVGTFGAIMVLRERVKSASHIVKIGAAGPIFGFIAALPVAVIGVYLSDVVSVDEFGSGEYFIRLGSSLIFTIIERIFYGDISGTQDILLHPVAFAGWIGFFITAINLIPIGQTDGGHIIFGLFPRHHRKISFLFVVLLFIIGFIFWYGWVIWGVLTLILGMRRIPFVPRNDITTTEKAIAFLSWVIFILTFMLAPISIEY